MKPLLLDLFCGAGGAAMGYHRAGFDIVGVDINPQPNYPFTFIQASALEMLTTRGFSRWIIPIDFTAIHASPPCQRYSLVQHSNSNSAEKHPDYLPIVRSLIRETGLPYVIENVVGAPMDNPLMLCGEMFGLDVIRHRLFESSEFIWQPYHPPHRGRVAGWRHGQKYDGPYVAAYGHGGGEGDVEDCQRAMKIDWMTNRHELIEAIPPAYTEYIGAQLYETIKAAA